MNNKWQASSKKYEDNKIFTVKVEYLVLFNGQISSQELQIAWLIDWRELKTWRYPKFYLILETSNFIFMLC